MRKTRVRFTVELNLDPVPGFNNDPQDYADRLRARLESEMPWYKPSISQAEIIPQEEQA